MSKYRGKDGRFAVKSFCYIDDKGYPRIGVGPLRGQRLHQYFEQEQSGNV